MVWDNTVTLGNVIQVGTIVVLAAVAYAGFSARWAVLEQLIEGHTRTLVDHAIRLDLHEARALRVVEDLQRLIGRVEFVSQKRRASDDWDAQ